ncbi:MAG: bifunctional phosphopantothenoylcysteine decarboxylase/phosphopantothenate--cysteine ligase CoaBC [Pseudomonadota bacterium]
MEKPSVSAKRILLIVSGGVAAYKTPDLVRKLRARGVAVRCLLTEGGAQFVTPLALGAVSEDKVYSDLFSLTDESEMGHIQLSRAADLVVVAPATANILAKMAVGIADDLATTALLATDKPVAVAPAMNVRMWDHAATQANIATLSARGVSFIGPDSGDMACGEFGVGRMVEPEAIADAVVGLLAVDAPLAGKRALVTSGPTREPIDPVRYISNHSSGKQGHAVAAALARLGAETTLVSGPADAPDPQGVAVRRVETAAEMLAACEAALPADVAVCAAAVADWRPVAAANTKMKKRPGEAPPAIALTQNPDILAALSAAGPKRPRLVVGFAAETCDLIANATSKLKRKGCDWVLANDVSPGEGVFGGDENRLHLVSAAGVDSWPQMSKVAAADQLAARIAYHFAQ